MSVNSELSAELQKMLNGCSKGDRQSQKVLYRQYYGYAMSVCLRYTATKEEAVEVLNEGFLKVFTKMDKYDWEKSFKGWLRRIMINTAIDYYRQYDRFKHFTDLEAASAATDTSDSPGELSYEEIVEQIHLLTPAYRAVFNLFVVDGYSHEEISEMLDISIGTSKSNLSRARALLQKRLTKLYNYERTPKVG